MKKIIKTLLEIFLASLSVFSIALSYNNSSITFYNGNSFFWIPIFILFYLLIKMSSKIINKRLTICATILTFILISFDFIGRYINTYLNLNQLFDFKSLAVNMIISIGHFVILYISIKLLYNFLDNYDFPKPKNLIKHGKVMFFISWLIIFVAYIPYFLTYYPGNLTPDSIDQIGQALGINELNNHHPVLHTFTIAFPMLLGKLFNNYNLGVSIFSVLQMLCVSGIFAFALYYMRKKNLPLFIRLISLLFYAFYPIHALYSITMWKDIPFALIMLLLTIIITEMITKKDVFFNSKLNSFLLIVIMLLLALFRNNGIYILILSFPLFIVFFKKHYKNILLIFVTVFILYMLWKCAIFRIFNIPDGSIREALSVPLQQIARTVRDHEDELTLSQKNELSNFFSNSDIGNLYIPTLSDPVKATFNDEYFKDNKINFIKVWISLFFKHPLTYIESFLCNSYGYWYPEAYNWTVAKGITADGYIVENLDLHTSSKINIKLDFYREKREIPMFSMIYSIGFAFWLALVSLTYCIYTKKYNLVLVFIPILGLWLTNLASPVFCEFRYIYSLFTCLPILLSVYLFDNNSGCEY